MKTDPIRNVFYDAKVYGDGLKPMKLPHSGRINIQRSIQLLIEAGSFGDLGSSTSCGDPTVAGGHCAMYLRLATWASRLAMGDQTSTKMASK